MHRRCRGGRRRSSATPAACGASPPATRCSSPTPAITVCRCSTSRRSSCSTSGATAATARHPRRARRAGRFDTPVAIAADHAGSVYVADRGTAACSSSPPAGEVVAHVLAAPCRTKCRVRRPGRDRGHRTRDANDGLRARPRRAGPATWSTPDGHLLAQRPLDLPGDPLGLAGRRRRVLRREQHRHGRPTCSRVRLDGTHRRSRARLHGSGRGARPRRARWAARASRRARLADPTRPRRRVRHGAASRVGGPFGGFIATKKHGTSCGRRWRRCRATPTCSSSCTRRTTPARRPPVDTGTGPMHPSPIRRGQPGRPISAIS